MIPIEIRDYYRRWQREDGQRSPPLLPQRLPVGPQVSGVQPHDLFVREGLQFRCLVKATGPGGARGYAWSDWQSVPVALEGYTDGAGGGPAEPGQEKAPGQDAPGAAAGG
jgi:hypothetical protein